MQDNQQENDQQKVDDVTKFRLIGAMIWLGLLIIIVPGWYANPVNFLPDTQRSIAPHSTAPVVYQTYRLPHKTTGDHTLRKADQNAATQTLSKPLVAQADLQKQTPLPTPQSTSVFPEVSSVLVMQPEVKAGQWLLMIYASKERNDALKVGRLLQGQYSVWIKEFPNSNTFSVRTGPYATRDLAEKDKTKIDRAIRTQSKIVQVK